MAVAQPSPSAADPVASQSAVVHHVVVVAVESTSVDAVASIVVAAVASIGLLFHPLAFEDILLSVEDSYSPKVVFAAQSTEWCVFVTVLAGQCSIVVAVTDFFQINIVVFPCHPCC